MKSLKVLILLAIALLLGAGAAQAATVKFENGTSKAIGIQNLDIDGTVYNVDFTSTGTVAAQVYGIFLGKFDFSLATTAAAAVDAVNSELNKADAAESQGQVLQSRKARKAREKPGSTIELWREII